MSHLSVQITEEDAKNYSEFARKQHEAQQATQDGVRVLANQGYLSMNTHGGEVQQHGVNRVTSEDFKTPGIVGSLGLNPNSPKSVVSIGGMETTLEMAHSLGLVGRDESGRYFDFDSKKVR